MSGWVRECDAAWEATPRIGDWILTFTGVEFWPIDPRPDEIRIEDIAHALSMQCRFSGHCSQFYSVAEHSLRVAELVPEKDKLYALLHDASEAYLVDLPRPIKRHTAIGAHYRIAEESLMAAISWKFGLPPEPFTVGAADKAMLCIEARDLLPNNSWWEKWSGFLKGTERPIGKTMDPREAESDFLKLFERLTR